MESRRLEVAKPRETKASTFDEYSRPEFRQSLVRDSLTRYLGDLTAHESVTVGNGEVESHLEDLSRLFQCDPSDIVAAFFDALIQYSAQHPEQQDHLAELREVLFSFSPNITNYLSIDAMVHVGAAVTREPRLQRTLGSTINGELVCSLSFVGEAGFNETLDEFAEAAEHLPVGEVLDQLDYMQTVAVQAVAQGGWAEAGRARAELLMQTLVDVRSEPLVQLIAGTMEQRIVKERQDSTVGVVEFSGDPANARIRSTHRPESAPIHDQLRCDPPLQPRDTARRVAPQTVGVFDHAGILRSIGRLPEGTLPEAFPIAQSLLDSARTHATALADDPRYIVEGLHTARLCTAELASRLHEQLPEKQVGLHQRWDEVFALCDRVARIQEDLSRFRGEQYHHAETQNEAASREFVERMLEQLPWHDVFDFTSADVREVEQLLHDGFFEEAFTRVTRSIESVSLPARLRQQALEAEVQTIVDELTELRSVHTHSFQNAEAAVRTRARTVSKQEAVVLGAYRDAVSLLATHHAEIAPILLAEVEGVQRQRDAQATPVSLVDMEAFINDPAWNPLAQAVGEDLPLALRHLYRSEVQEAIAAQLGIRITEVPLRSQIAFLDFLSHADQQTYARLGHLLERMESAARQSFLSGFLAGAYDSAYCNQLLSTTEQVLERLPQEVHENFFTTLTTYGSAVDHMIDAARDLTKRQDIPEAVGQVAVVQRLGDVLSEIQRTLAISEDGQHALQQMREIVAELHGEDTGALLNRVMLKRIAYSLQEPKKNDRVTTVKEYADRLRGPADASVQEMHLKLLQRMGHLQPIPEIHWRVDRSLDEYRRRFGFSVIDFLKAHAVNGKKKVLLEFGPGNGLAKRERSAAAEVTDSYQDFAIADTLYYSLGEVCTRMLNAQELAAEIGEPLTPEDLRVLGDFLYKVTVIADGETGADHFAYDETIRRDIQHDVNALTRHYDRIQQKLAVADSVPTTISSRDRQGTVIYPYKVRLADQSTAVQKAIAALRHDMTKYLSPEAREGNLFSCIDAYPDGVLVGDFSNVQVLPADSIDVAFGVRSTVYKRGEEYVSFLQDVAQRLREDGIYIDDSFRDSDGFRYRFAEVAKALDDMDVAVPVHVILGPGFPGEDFRKNDVPLALVIGKQADHSAEIRGMLGKGFSIVPFSKLVKNTNYLQTLDAESAVAQEVSEYEQPQAAAT